MTFRSRSVAKYACKLKANWREIDHYLLVRDPESEEWAYAMNGRVFKFHMGLTPEDGNFNIQILNQERVPNLEEAISIVNEDSHM